MAAAILLLMALGALLLARRVFRQAGPRSADDQDPQLQLDALATEDCLKTYTDTATGTKAGRPARVEQMPGRPARR